MKKFFLASLISLISSSVCFAASFDCQKASTLNEQTICSNPALSKLDEQMAYAYKVALRLSSSDSLKSEQRSWVQSNKACEATPDQTANCLTAAYESRIDQLSQIIASNSGYLGAKFSDAQADSSGEGFVTVSDVIFNGPLFNAGIKNGDQIVSVNGSKFRNAGDAAALIFVKPGTPINIGFRSSNGSVSNASVTPITKDELALLGATPAPAPTQEEPKSPAEDQSASIESDKEKVAAITEVTAIEVLIIVLIGALLYGLGFFAYLKYPKINFLAIATPYDLGSKRELSEAEKLTKSRRCIRELFYLVISIAIFGFVAVSAVGSQNTNLLDATFSTFVAFAIAYIVYVLIRVIAGWASKCPKCKNMYATICTNSYKEPTGSYEKRNNGFANGRDCHFVKVIETGINHSDHECIVCGHTWHATSRYERQVSEYHT